MAYAPVDYQLYQTLTQAVGDWSSATGVAPPSQQQLAAWGANNPDLAAQFQAESQNIGWYATRAHLGSTQEAIWNAAKADPRYSQLDPMGQQILAQLYNLKQSGYGGDIGQYTPLPAPTPPPTGTTGIGGPSAPTSVPDPTQALLAQQQQQMQQNAWAILQQTLSEYGFSGADLQSLLTWAKQEIIDGKSSDQVMLDLEQRPEFIRRFPAIPKLSAEGIAISPAEYIAAEKSYAAIDHSAGLPPNFTNYDALIAAQVSPSEYSQRIQQGYVSIATAPPETVKAMQDYYGVTPGQLAAYFMDPTKATPILLQQAVAAQIGGAAATSHFGQISRDDAERLAKMGVSYQQALTGFQTLGQEHQLYNPLPGQGQRYDFNTQNLLGAQFGSDALTHQQLLLQAQEEKGYFSGGVGVTSQGQKTGAGEIQR